MRIALLTILFLSAWYSGSGQLNFYAGYRAGFLSTSNFVNSAIQSYNSAPDTTIFDGLEDTTFVISYYRDGGFKNASFLNGVDLGLTYRFDNWLIEASWKNKRTHKRATHVTETIVKKLDSDGNPEVRSTNRNTDDDRITTSIHAASIGYQYAIGMVSLGATLDYNWLKIRTDFESSENPDNTDSDSKGDALSSHFSMSFNFGSGGVIGLTLQPYAQIYWNEYSLSDGQSGGKLNTYGIALIIRNGPQPYY